MEVLDRLDTRLGSALAAKGWRRLGTRRYVGATHMIEVLPSGYDNRLTIFYGRCRTPGDPSRLAECSRITMADRAEVERFLSRL